MCAHTGRNFMNLNFQAPYYDEFVENMLSMGCIGQLARQVLSRPVFIVLSIPPKPGWRHIIDISFVRHPDLRLVLTISKRELRDGILW
jgi:hypothetical protein